MAKGKTEADIAAKKDKKRKHEDVVDAEEVTPKKSKKEKKEKKEQSKGEDAGAGAVESVVEINDKGNGKAEKGEINGTESTTALSIPVSALVPFANPLAGEKDQKKVLKTVKKGAKAKALKRGVKECVKSIRKSPLATPASLGAGVLPNGIVILAADISPMDVISHIPVLCEDHNIPYVFVPSRAELGAAGSTKRPTSVVMLTPTTGKKPEGDDEDGWSEAYKELHKLALKLGQHVKV